MILNPAALVAWLIGLAVVHSPNWPAVKHLFFNGAEFRKTFPDVASKFVRNIEYFLICEVVILAFALLLAVLRSLPGSVFFPLRLLAIIYTDLFRGIPTILLVYLVGFGIPALQLSGLPTDPVVLGEIALSLSYGAYVAEVYRAGIASVHRGQRDAALAIGLTEGQALRHVIVPQGVRRVGPPLLNDFIALQKDVALVSILGPQEAFRAAQIISASTFNYTPFIAAAVLYLAVTVPLARIVDRLGVHGVAR